MSQKRFLAYACIGLMQLSFFAGAVRAQYEVKDIYGLGLPSGYNPPAAGRASDSSGVAGYAQITASPSPTHALYWSWGSSQPVDLQPNLPGIVDSAAVNIYHGQQVGLGDDAQGNEHPLLWTGTAASAVDLTPTNLTGFSGARLMATDGVQQVGEARLANLTISHPMLWSGTADSAVDLLSSDPKNQGLVQGVKNGEQVGEVGGFAALWKGTAASLVVIGGSGAVGPPQDSIAYGTSGSQEVGSMLAPDQIHFHSMLWNGSAQSAVDLTPNQFPWATTSMAFDTNGSIQVGYAASLAPIS